jgi:hypothetical protein
LSTLQVKNQNPVGPGYYNPNDKAIKEKITAVKISQTDKRVKYHNNKQSVPSVG